MQLYEELGYTMKEFLDIFRNNIEHLTEIKLERYIMG